MQEILQSLNPLARNYAQPQTPPHMKKMAASGKLPLPPQQMVLLLFLLAQETDQELAALAAQSFKELPDRVFTALLQSTSTQPSLLNFISRQFTSSHDKIQAILLHPNTPDETFAWLASLVDGELIDLIVQNQQRHIRHAPIVQNLLQNAQLAPSQRARIIEFALRERIPTGLTSEELKPFVAEGLIEELSESEAAPHEDTSDEDIELPDYMLEEKEGDDQPHKRFPTEEELTEEEEELRLTIEQQAALWSVSQKIKAAMKGNKQVRGLLIRDSNRLVCTAVMKNPKITESEVIAISGSRSVSDDVIREITRNREWMKIYTVKLNLSNNPKCPTATAIRLLNHLRTNDLKLLIGNKGVPSEVSRNAKKIFQTRSGK